MHRQQLERWTTVALIFNGTIFVGVTLYWLPVLLASLVFWILATAKG